MRDLRTEATLHGPQVKIYCNGPNVQAALVHHMLHKASVLKQYDLPTYSMHGTLAKQYLVKQDFQYIF